MDQALKKEEIPAGGIADFVMTDEQIEQLEAEELKEQFGTNGIAQFSDVGKRMANFGRYGDDTVAHVETGELIVPRALIEKNPELKESIFKHLKELGVEDPERYVVGESKNSVNPTTGLPEFFFKKIFKSISNIAKGVGKALKKAAPIIIPMALNYFAPGLGTVMSGALGAGITTLVQGGSVKDAFKSALVGGATGAVAAGFSGPKTGPSGFMDNIAADVNMGTTNVQNAFTQGSFEPLTSSTQPSIRDLFSEETNVSADTSSNEFVSRRDASSGFEGAGMKPVGSKIPTVKGDPYVARGLSSDGSSPLITDAGISGDLYTNKLGGADLKDFGFQTDNFYGKGNLELNVPRSDIPSFTQQLKGGSPTFGFDAGTSTGSGSTSMYDTLKEYGSKASDFIMPSDASTEALQSQASKILAGDTTGKMTYKQAFELAKDQLNPNFLTKYGPSLALATAAGAAGGFFDAPEEEEQEAVRTGLDVYRENPDQYDVRDVAVQGSTGATTSPTSYGFEYNPYLFSKTPFQTVAEGGEIFPRRVGGIMPDEGIPNKDSVRAMLMPGEFVMTTDAVKGLGGGDMNKGINNMYSVMRNLEQRGKAMA
jgi:hypothetical protein